MKTALITATLIALTATAASARTLPAEAARQLYTCEGGVVSRVATHTQPAPCCEGMLGCPQLLGNTGLVRPRRANRT